MMSYRYLTLVLVAVFSIIWSDIAAATEGAKIRIFVAHVELGEINQGEKVDHLFHFQNIGDEPLLIGKVKTSCGCTVALPSKTRLLPGEEGEIKVTFDSGRFSGEVHKEVSLASNDKSDPVVKLTFSTKVRPAITVLPEIADFGSINQKESKEIILVITNQGKDNLDISTNDLPLPNLVMSPVSAVLGANESVKIKVQMSAPLPEQRISAYILINTNCILKPQLRIPVYALGVSR